MPINYKDYCSDWKEISKYIREIRANNKCEWCNISNGEIGYRGNKDNKWYSFQEVEDALDKRGYDYFENELKHYINKHGLLKRNPTKIVLTVAHYDQTKTNNNYVKNASNIWDLEKNNLFALCQSCHLKHDLQHHIEKRKQNKELKTGQLSFI